MSLFIEQKTNSNYYKAIVSVVVHIAHIWTAGVTSIRTQSSQVTIVLWFTGALQLGKGRNTQLSDMDSEVLTREKLRVWLITRALFLRGNSSQCDVERDRSCFQTARPSRSICWQVGLTSWEINTHRCLTLYIRGAPLRKMMGHIQFNIYQTL